MRHKVFGRQLNRSSNERKRLLRNLSRSLILHGSMTTTLGKAKAMQGFVEKLVTKAKNNDLTSRRLLLSKINDVKSVDKLLTEIGPLFKSTNGGYTRIIKLVSRAGDNASQAIITFTKPVSKSEQVKKEKKVKPKKEAKSKETPEKPKAKKKESKSKE